MNYKDKVEVFDKLLGIAAKVGILIGGVALLFYCWSIGYFPRDITIGDGLLFIFIAAGFGVLYVLFLASLTGFGLVLRPVWHWGQKAYAVAGGTWCRWRKKPFLYSPFELMPMGAEHIIFAIFGLFFVIGFTRRDAMYLPMLLVSAFGCAFIWSVFQRDSAEYATLSKQSDRSVEEGARRRGLEKSRVILLAGLFASPLVVGGMLAPLSEGAMRLLNLRKENAVVHVAKPYGAFIASQGIAGTKSDLGEEYLRFDQVDVLLAGPGSSVVISLKRPGSGNVQVTIPNDHILIAAQPRASR